MTTTNVIYIYFLGEFFDKQYRTDCLTMCQNRDDAFLKMRNRQDDIWSKTIDEVDDKSLVTGHLSEKEMYAKVDSPFGLYEWKIFEIKVNVGM